jgi:hypothetical protein
MAESQGTSPLSRAYTGVRIHHWRRKIVMIKNSFVFAALAALLLVIPPAAMAGANDYEFQPVTPEIKNGAGAEFAVRLIDKRSGKPVPGAVLFRTRLDMSPDSMDEMLAKHEPLKSDDPGVYRFKADITMAGGWAFKLQTKVPGEPDTVEGSVVFTAKD